MTALFGAIAGRVTTRDGTPVPGAAVAIVGGEQAHPDIAALAGPDGSFRFGRLSPGRYRVEARSRGVTGAADVVVAEGRSAQVEIRLDE